MCDVRLAMTIKVKICGIDTKENIDIAVNCGANYIGFVFYAPSPRYLSVEKAKLIIPNVPQSVKKVGLFVDPNNIQLETVMNSIDLDQIQLHGSETPSRVSEINRITNLPIIKAIKISDLVDLEYAEIYSDVTDYFLFDAKIPDNLGIGLPGGNAVSFDWNILKNLNTNLPWMLAGGLIAQNLEEAIEVSGAKIVDVSSGVENRRGKKDPELIKEFIRVAKSI